MSDARPDVSLDTRHYAACDLGAESGRVIVGTLSAGRLTLDEAHRFATGACRVGGSLRWNILRIFEELHAGVRAAYETYPSLASISVDAWGVDYVYIRDGEPMVALPYHYRDPRTDNPYALLDRDSRAAIFAETGIQSMSINTLIQMIDDVARRSAVLRAADGFLTIADYVNYLFSGVALNEASAASTTQLFNPVTGDWSAALIERFELSPRLFPRIVRAGTVLGSVRVEHDLGDHVRVVATCSHDTAAAVAAVPATTGEERAFLSSGTWSLLGVERDRPLINAATLEANFTNEVGFDGTIRLLKNIAGLWIVQECRRDWAKRGLRLEYAQIAAEASDATPLRSLIDPDDFSFSKPDDMVEKVRAFCRKTRQPLPGTVGEIARCVFEGLALLYTRNLQLLETLTGRQIATLHIVGGGSQNGLLNQCVADATGRTVIAGPVEATAIGNVLVQSIADGRVASLSEMRRIVGESFPTTRYSPGSSVDWQTAETQLAKLSALAF